MARSKPGTPQLGHPGLCNMGMYFSSATGVLRAGDSISGTSNFLLVLPWYDPTRESMISNGGVAGNHRTFLGPIKNVWSFETEIAQEQHLPAHDL